MPWHLVSRPRRNFWMSFRWDFPIHPSGDVLLWWAVALIMLPSHPRATGRCPRQGGEASWCQRRSGRAGDGGRAWLLELQPEDFIYLKVSPIRGTQRCQVKGKLAPWYIGPYYIIEKIGAVAYRLELLPEMSDMHDEFHISQLKRCPRVLEEQAPMETMDLQPDL